MSTYTVNKDLADGKIKQVLPSINAVTQTIFIKILNVNVIQNNYNSICIFNVAGHIHKKLDLFMKILVKKNGYRVQTLKNTKTIMFRD